LGGLDHGVDIGDMAGHRLFNQNIEAVREQVERNGHMQVAGRRVDHQVDVLMAEQLAVIRIGGAADLGSGPFATVRQRVDNGDDLIQVLQQ
jgi:hypothetical protein